MLFSGFGTGQTLIRYFISAHVGQVCQLLHPSGSAIDLFALLLFSLASLSAASKAVVRHQQEGLGAG
jgi:hypothetical protein